MHSTVDYSKSPAPRFDAVEDVIQWFGAKWDEVSSMMEAVTDPHVFGILADFAGIKGFPVECWYDLYHGEGAYRKAWAALEAGAGVDPELD